MISREDAQKFFSQDKVWIYDNVGSAIEGEPLDVDRERGVYRVDNSVWCHYFSLEDPRPKRVFEDGALYPVLFNGYTDPATATWNSCKDQFWFHRVSHPQSDFSFIGDKLPPELWEKK